MAKDTRVIKLCYALIGLLLTGMPIAANAQATSNHVTPVTPAPAPAPQPDYHPSMGDLMTMAVQPRHIKLALAGKELNWVYASYELSELRNAFARIARTIPQYQSMDTAALVTAMTKPPLDELDQAIRASDNARFIAAYARLTQACNACHQSQSHAFIVIQVPETGMFPDQDFRPVSR
jgi:hypothetical protein